MKRAIFTRNRPVVNKRCCIWGSSKLPNNHRKDRRRIELGTVALVRQAIAHTPSQNRRQREQRALWSREARGWVTRYLKQVAVGNKYMFLGGFTVADSAKLPQHYSTLGLRLGRL